MPPALPPAGPRIRPVPWTPELAPGLLAIYQDPEVSRFIGLPVLTDLDGALERIDFIRTKAYPEGHGVWALHSEVDGVVGTLMVKHPGPSEGAPPPADVEVGWHLRRDCWGRGFATEGGWLGLRHAFENLGLDEVIALIDTPNTASSRVAGRLGMARVGRTARYYGQELDVYALSREDFLGDSVQALGRATLERAALSAEAKSTP